MNLPMLMGWMTAADAMELLWRNALLAIPLALTVAAICKWLPCRPATRHALWCMVLLSLMAPPIAPHLDWSSTIARHDETTSNEEVRETSPAESAAVNAATPIATAPVAPAPRLTKLAEQPKRSQTSLTDRWLAYFNSFNPIVSYQTNVSPGVSTPSPMELRTSARALNSPPTIAPTAASASPAALAAIETVATEIPTTTSTSPVEIASAASVLTNPPTFPTACGDAGLLDPPHSGGPPTGPHSETFPNNVSAASPQVFSNSSAPLASASSSMQATVKQWQAQVIAIRDALASLPPLPAGIWLGGSAAVIAVLLVRIVRFKRLIASSQIAPREVQRFVQREARKLRMSGAPAVYFTQKRISPLIWCGGRRLMLLPQALWEELDEIGRCAVVMHELAHLKRRDHWVCWGDLVIGCVYWWHPIAWWVRRRIRDEADFCCDAWVTALLPSGRSAYAKALLATRQFVSDSQQAIRNHRAVPVVGLGACTPKTKQFARRLTMVMTQRSKPSMSILGTALATCLATAGWLAAPILACPPEESQAQQSQLRAELKAKEKARAQAVVVAPGKKRSPEAQRELSTYEAHRAERDQQPRAPHAGDDLRGRIDHLEHRLDRITEQLERMIEGPRSQAPQGQFAPAMRGTVSGVASPAAPGQMRSPRAVGGAALAVPPAPPALPAVPAPPSPQTSVRMRMAEGRAMVAMEDSGEVEIRLYRLPAGKRDDFYKFMARQDVPVLVSQAPEGVNVHATPRQHEFIKGFIDLIHPEGRQGQNGAGQPAPRSGAQGFGGISPTEIDRLNKLAREYEVAAQQAYASGDVKRAKEIAQQLRSKHQSANDHMRGLHQRAGELRRKAVELQRQSEQLESKAQSLNESERFQIMSQAEAIAAEAEALEEQADVEDELAETIQEQIEEAQDHVDEVIEAIADAQADEADAADDAENEDSEESD
jgi:beta-lactamase regulating signal transducer with metallopeptidase domain